MDEHQWEEIGDRKDDGESNAVSIQNVQLVEVDADDRWEVSGLFPLEWSVEEGLEEEEVGGLDHRQVDPGGLQEDPVDGRLGWNCPIGLTGERRWIG